MSLLLNKIAIVDTGFWYALFDERDQYFRDAQRKVDLLMSMKYVLPWPTLYETLGTRFVRRPLYIRKFEIFLKRPNAVLLDDANYRMQALDRTLSTADGKHRPISLVDNVLRLIIDDRNFKLHCLFSFNHPDFTDVCRRRQIELL
ncbi:MAG: hypothetical protein KKE86_09265 [Planctomycetes bacterium]|nr:hypothetical protein [Planctomycetota bacterium]MBU4399509.1 hypothetical protein [Planctomycetota bacterium]MCG2684905.1 hypothetical protein [Planctomycetales bacterium]